MAMNFDEPLCLTDERQGRRGGGTDAALWAAAKRLGLAYWLGVFGLSSVLWAIVGTDPFESALGKMIHYAICSVLTWAITALVLRLHRARVRPGRSLMRLVALCFVLSLIAAPVWALIGFGIYTAFVWPLPALFNWRDFGYDMVYGGGLFFGWSCLVVTLIYSFEMRAGERRLAALREEALTAQMRALHYQVNPHFLFNTLNSIAGLIEEGASARAGHMVLSLAAFLRATLTLDPLQDVPLAAELALQRDYLAIEGERFSDRMDLRIDVPEALGGALVPSLILQPLIENALKHGLGRTTGRVAIALTARGEGGRLRLTVENDMPPGDGGAPLGMGLGLRNLSDRLRLRFHDDCRFEAGPVAPGRYRVALDLPLVMA